MKTFFKIPKLSVVFIILMTICVSLKSRATDYYVASNGNDGNPGTIGSPWLTPNRAASVANAGVIVAGDHIYFRRGDVFSGHMQITNNSVWGGSANSGTSSNPIVIGAYGTGARPIMQFLSTATGAGPYGRFIIHLLGVDYWTVQDINFTDLQGTTTNDKWSTANNSVAVQLGFEGDGVSNHCLVQNDSISLCGIGVEIIGDQNTVTNCHMGNFRDLDNTNDGGRNDYGANGVVIHGSDNIITHNTITSAWAESYDFGFNGGAIEMFNNCDRNIIMYNNIYDCGGLAEFGGDNHTVSSDDNQFAYNKITNCGGMIYCNIGDTFAIEVANTKFYNNVVVEDNSSRFSGTAHFGDSLTHSAAIAHLTKDVALFQYNTAPVATYLNIVKNNVIQLTTGLNVFKSGDTHLSHTNNVFVFGTSTSAEIATPDATETTTSSAIFTNITPANPINWDFYPLAGSPQIGGGVNVSLTPDFDGYSVASTPTIGPLEYRGLTSITTSTITPAGYCAGGSISVPFTVIGAANAGNTFTAQLSNSSGSFSSPVTVGTLSSTTAGTISGTIPGGTTAGTGYYIRVISSNPSITGSSFGPVTVSTATPSTPGAITGPTNVCLYFTTPATYTISAVTNATSYTWTPPTGGTIVSGQGTTSVQVLFSGSFTTGVLSVNAVSFCGTSGTRSLTLTKINPSTPADITGPTEVCSYLSGTPTAVYTTSSSQTNTYTWTYPTGGSGSATTTTPSTTVTYSTTFTPGNVTVYASNGCASSSTKSLAIVKVPVKPGLITGNSSPCPSTSDIPYSVTDLGYTYTWTVPATATITGGQGTHAITVSFGSGWVGGNITVTATNSCGTSSSRVLACTKGCGRQSISGIPSNLQGTSASSAGIFPNPSNGNFKIQVRDVKATTPVFIEIANGLGDIVYKKTAHCVNGTIELKLQHTLSSGVYIAKYMLQGEIKTTKLIISK